MQDHIVHSMVAGRLYFGMLFFNRILRCMKYAKLGSSKTRTFIERFLMDYTPEGLPIPGPLVHILQSLTVSNSDDPLFGLISPNIRDSFRPTIASELWQEDTLDFAYPNIPLIAIFF